MTQIQTSNASNLPLDVISEIFKNYSTPLAIDLQPNSFPWFLGHICARWRKVFLSMSTHFWGNIAITFTRVKKPFQNSAAFFERAMDKLNFCLKCNEGCPLSVSFKMGSHYIQEYAYVIDILDLLIAQSMRWFKAVLYIHVPELQRLHQIKGRTPLLQSLDIAQVELLERNSNVGSVYERFADTFEDCPSLTRLQLVMFDIKKWKFNWSSIVVLQLNLSTTLDQLVAILSQSVHLEELQVDWRKESDSELIDVARSMITLPSLKKLTVSDNVFGVLTTPGLEYLSIAFRWNNHDGTATAFLRRSSCPLGHLVLREPSRANAVEVLSAIPGLSVLEIYQYNGVEELIKLLNCHLPGGLLMCQLKSLQLHIGGQLTPKDVVELSTMVASRARSVEVDGLQELVLWGKHGCKVDLTILQSQCEEEDVKLTVFEHDDF
ncbi:hypothetical protein AX14_006114 [Amanita brunnescens Koide BX004]|nr:hypothetical protein AX14_006114 [Amanita brunnescens Koide BX004]